MSKVHIIGAERGSSDQEIISKIQQAALLVSDDLAWLKSGQTVLLKPAVNSADPFPATTHPLSVLAMANLLSSRGAQVIVGDQSGVEHVVQGANGYISGDSGKCFYEAGGKLIKKIEFTAFEKRGWDSYYNFQSAKTVSWSNGFFVTDLIKEVDHIVSLPRLSTHTQAGVSLGFKNLVGLLRLDSRVEFHADGPFSQFINLFAKRSKIKKYPKQDKFFAKMTEISAAVEDKLRLTLFTGTKAQVNLGPDKYLLTKALSAKVVEPKVGLILAGNNQVATEASALAFLTFLYQHSPVSARLVEKVLLFFNGQAKELGRQNVWENPFIKQAIKIGLGEKGVELVYHEVPIELQKILNELTL